MDFAYFENKKQKALDVYTAQRTIYSPYFKKEVILNSNGFHHLQFSSRSERNKEEQVLKFTLLPLGLRIIHTATTLQEYTKLDSKCIKAFKKLCGQKTCFEWEEPLVKIFDEAE